MTRQAANESYPITQRNAKPRTATKKTKCLLHRVVSKKRLCNKMQHVTMCATQKKSGNQTLSPKIREPETENQMTAKMLTDILAQKDTARTTDNIAISLEQNLPAIQTTSLNGRYVFDRSGRNIKFWKPILCKKLNIIAPCFDRTRCQRIKPQPPMELQTRSGKWTWLQNVDLTLRENRQHFIFSC